MNRLLAKLRPADRIEAHAPNGNGHVRLVPAPPPARRSSYVVTAAETAPCTCPEACERDHGNE
jgi:hypothetical protein